MLVQQREQEFGGDVGRDEVDADEEALAAHLGDKVRAVRGNCVEGEGADLRAEFAGPVDQALGPDDADGRRDRGGGQRAAGGRRGAQQRFGGAETLAEATRPPTATTPPPRILPVSSTSGVTPARSAPHQAPRRPRPVWISSRIITAPASVQACPTWRR